MSKVTITTATKLTADQLKTLTSSLEKKYGKTVKIDTVIDPSILGGVVITIGSRQVDNSYKTRIHALEQQVLATIAE